MGLTEERRKEIRMILDAWKAGGNYLAHLRLVVAEELQAALAEAEREREEWKASAHVRQDVAEREVRNWGDDVNDLIIRLRQLEKENGRLRAALAREVGAFAQAVREGQVPGCYLTSAQAQQVREALEGEKVVGPDWPADFIAGFYRCWWHKERTIALSLLGGGEESA